MLLNHHRVLLVEDEAILAMDLGHIIRNAGAEIAGHAPALARAMMLADLPRLTLALLDFRLGAVNSLPVAAKLHARGVPFVFHTGCGMSEVSAAWPQVAVLAKPAAPGDVVRILALAASKASSRLKGWKAA
jgi:DNA-binding NarL/FixJ family response regulator